MDIFCRPLVLTEQGVHNLIALIKEWGRNPPPPEPFESLLETLSDCVLLEEAERRTASCDPKEIVSQEKIMAELGIEKTDLKAVEVEIE